MSETKYTPGPWKMDDGAPFHRNRVWTQDMRPIVNLCSMGLSPADIDPEAQANGCLIAAAPNMLKALRRCLNYIENSECEFGERLDCGDLARAAIAAAEGRS